MSADDVLTQPLAVYVFADRVLVIGQTGEVTAVPRNAEAVAGTAAEQPEILVPDVNTAVLQTQDGAIKLAASNGPDILLGATAVQGILMELCARVPGIVGEIYRKQTGLKPGS